MTQLCQREQVVLAGKIDRQIIPVLNTPPSQELPGKNKQCHLLYQTTLLFSPTQYAEQARNSLFD